MISAIPQARARLFPSTGDDPPPVDDFKNSAFSSISDTIDHSQAIFDPLTVQESVENNITSTISYTPA
jgi:hypothetical protein